MNAKARFNHWEREAKDGVEKIASAKKIASTEKDMDEAKGEMKFAWLAAVAVGDVKAQDNLDRVQDAMAVVEEASCKAEATAARLEVE